MDLSVVPYGETGNGQVDAQAATTPRPPKYRECLRNHAAAIGGQAFDGCGEFMPAGAHGSIDALKCAACSCHRNFHRRDDNGNGPPRRPPLLLTPPPFPPFLPQPMPVAYQQIRPAGIYEPNRAGSETPPRREDPEPPRRPKRNRTRFTPEQKEKMQAFAEKLGWRIHKHDDVALKEFCVEVGIKRHVLKVWIHNNKNNLAQATKRDGGAAAAAVPAPISV